LETTVQRKLKQWVTKEIKEICDIRRKTSILKKEQCTVILTRRSGKEFKKP